MSYFSYVNYSQQNKLFFSVVLRFGVSVVLLCLRSMNEPTFLNFLIKEAYIVPFRLFVLFIESLLTKIVWLLFSPKHIVYTNKLLFEVRVLFKKYDIPQKCVTISI